MPIHEYSCKSCGIKFDYFVRSNTESEPVSCPSCQSQTVERVVSKSAEKASTRWDSYWPRRGG